MVIEPRRFFGVKGSVNFLISDFNDFHAFKKPICLVNCLRSKGHSSFVF